MFPIQRKEKREKENLKIRNIMYTSPYINHRILVFRVSCKPLSVFFYSKELKLNPSYIRMIHS